MPFARLTKLPLGLYLALCIGVAACDRDAATGDDADGSSSDAAMLIAADLGEQNLMSPAEYKALPEYASANAEYGQRLSMQCRACHTLEKGGAHMLGPNLYGFIGRQAGSVAGFPFSRALSESSFVWTPRALDAWLAAPTEFLPGNTMLYQGMPRADDRNDLIAGLLVHASPSDE